MNYKDLQNIAFLSQEILTESATQEHNALDRWPYTSPYLQESTEVYDEEYRKLPVGKMMWKAVNRVEREADTRVDRENAVNDPYGHLSFDRAAEEQEKAEKNKERNYKMIRVADTHSKKKAKAKSKLKTEQVDLYDIILSHLLEEGYAETVENAESIMVNMSEDWRDSIFEEVLDEKIATPPSRWNARRGLDPERRRSRRSSDFYTYGGENQDPDERTISTSKGEGGITKNPKKLRKQKAIGEHG